MAKEGGFIRQTQVNNLLSPVRNEVRRVGVESYLDHQGIKEFMKPIKSTDPRKADIVNALKGKTDANRVTKVMERPDGNFEGHCLSGNRSGYQSLGVVVVTPEEVKKWNGNEAFLMYFGMPI